MDDPQMSDETARWLSAAMLTLASALNKSSEMQKAREDDTYGECQNYYNRMFGTS